MLDTKVRHEQTTRWLLIGGVVGPLLFIVLFLIEGATRPGYSIARNYVSDLALSNQGWEQIANFLVCGALCVGFAVALHRVWPTGRASVWGPRLVGLIGVELLIAGVCVTDPGRGYPPGAPLAGMPVTWHGWVHGINGGVLFTLVLPVACFVLAHRFAAESRYRGWATYCRVTAILILALTVAQNVGAPIMEHGGDPVPIGLFQRAQIIIGWGWLALTALRLLRQQEGMGIIARSHGHSATAQQPSS